MSKHLGRVLSLAGSDSGGGAGIQADIKTITAMGGYAATAITALTAQNTLMVTGIHNVPPEFIVQQAEAVLSDIGADCLKTGMLSNEAIIAAVASIARKYRTIPLVVDPVMVATSGAMLLEKEALAALTTQLLPLATLVTPNVPEAEFLAQVLINGEEGMIKAGQRIIEQTGCLAVLVKGGHLKGETIADVLVTKQGEINYFTSPRIPGTNTHGTGCTLASAIATRIALGDSLLEAIPKARYFVQQAIATAKGFGKGHGPLNHGWNVKTTT